MPDPSERMSHRNPMDVTCNRCDTEYEFEEALVSSRGTTVKCTHCGHLFKVRRAARETLSGDTTHWTVRRADGVCTALDSLSALPGLITEGGFGREDELSRTGKLWRRLGDIEELDEHFTAADRRGPSRRPRDQAQRQPEKREGAHPQPVPDAPSAAPEGPPAPRGVRHESRQHAWARLLTSAAIVLAVAFWFFSLPPTGERFGRAQTSAPVDPGARFVTSAEHALASFRLDQLDRAHNEYIKALAHHEGDAQILSGISRVHALWAQELRDQRALLQLDPTETNAALLEAHELQARTHVQQAQHYAELARQAAPGNARALLAQADALRLAGDERAAHTILARAPSSAEALRIRALLSLGEANAPDGDQAAALAARAVRADPTQLAPRFLEARLLLAQGDRDALGERLHAIKALDPNHPEARRLEALASAPPTRPQVTETVPLNAPSNNEAASLIERGRSLLEAGQTAGAKRMFDHALTLQPDSVPAQAGLGQVAIARGRPVQAIDPLVAAALRGDAESLFALADLYRRLGRQREALAAYHSYLQHNPQGPQQDLAKAQIERLGEQFASARKP